MTISLESQVLFWINEELSDPNNRSGHVPIQLLMIRLALMSREHDEDLTQSIELSLSAFDRATMYRLLRQLERRSFVTFVDEAGKPVVLSDSLSDPNAQVKSIEPSMVLITAQGKQELARLTRLLQPPQ